jgi:DNA (cytosine-5)-methyltransferase 1
MTDLTYGSLFSGVGGLDLAVEETFGARPIWHSEIDTSS